MHLYGRDQTLAAVIGYTVGSIYLADYILVRLVMDGNKTTLILEFLL